MKPSKEVEKRNPYRNDGPIFRGDQTALQNDAWSEGYLVALDDHQAEVKKCRQRMFAMRKSADASHTTACTIWGDDGQGGTAEGFKEPLPCNCGALENYATQRADRLQAEVGLHLINLEKADKIIEALHAQLADQRYGNKEAK